MHPVPTLLLDCIPLRDNDNLLLAVELQLSLGQPGDQVEAGRMDIEAIQEGLQLVELLHESGPGEGGWTIEQQASGWLWNSLAGLPGAIAELRNRPGPWQGFEKFVFSVMAPDEVALLPWEQLQVPVVRRSIRRPPRSAGCAALLPQLGAAFTHGLGRPFFVPLDQLQLKGRLLERFDGEPAVVAEERPGQAFDLALLNLGGEDALDDMELREVLTERGVELAALVLPPSEGGIIEDGLLRLLRIAAAGAGIPLVFGNRHPVSAAQAEAALESFVDQATSGVPLSTCIKEVQKAHGLGWVLLCNQWDAPFYRADPPQQLLPVPIEPGQDLELNQAGAPVRQLQQRLERVGLPVGPGRCDGVFGPDTERAVQVLQRVAGLQASGVADAETFALLDEMDRAAVIPLDNGLIPRGYRPYQPGELLGAGHAGPGVEQLGRLGEYIFGTEEMLTGLMDDEATLRWAASQRALDMFPSRTFDPWSIPPEVTLQHGEEGELRWLPAWLCEYLFDNLVAPSDGGPILEEQMEQLLRSDDLGSTFSSVDLVPSVSRAAMELLLVSLLEEQEPEEQPRGEEAPPADAPQEQPEPTQDNLPPIVAWLEDRPSPPGPERSGSSGASRKTERELEPNTEVELELSAEPEHEPEGRTAGRPADPAGGDPAEDAADEEAGTATEERIALARLDLVKVPLSPDVEAAPIPVGGLPDSAPPQGPAGAGEVQTGPPGLSIAYEADAAATPVPAGPTGRSQRALSSATWALQVQEVEEDEPFLLPPRGGPLEQVLDSIHYRYSFPLEVTGRVLTELDAGRHVVLTGPAGSGKTSLARQVARSLGYSPFVVTPSADWTSCETIGRLTGPQGWPGSVTPGPLFRPGVILEVVMSNWEATPTADAGIHYRRLGRGETGPDGPPARGSWLILDELNRGDMDLVLGGLLNAMETRRLRIPSTDEQGGTVEIPIPRDFRIIATLNATDRHTMFHLSSALKRRFAFVEVPVTNNLGQEWSRVSQHSDIIERAGQDWLEDQEPEERVLMQDLRRFVYLVRAFQPLGSAQLLAATRYLATSARHQLLTPEQRLHQAVAGSVLPGMEGTRQEILQVLQVWAAPATAQPPARGAPDGDASTATPGEILGALLAECQGLLEDEQVLDSWLNTLEDSWPAPDPATDDRDMMARLGQCLCRRGGPYPDLAYQLWWMAQESSGA